MLASWPGLLMHDLVGIGLLFFLCSRSGSSGRLCGALSPVGRESWPASEDEERWPRAGHCQAWRDDRSVPSAG